MSTKTNIQTAFTSIGTVVKNVRSSITGTGTDNAAAVTAAIDNAGTHVVGAININTTAIAANAAAISAANGASVTSVNGINGPGDITVGTDNVAEGSTNLYHTVARAKAAVVNDATAASDTTYSSAKIAADIATAKAEAKAELIDSSPAVLDTFTELAAALGGDENFATTVGASIALKANIANTFSVAQLGADFDTHDFLADWTAAIA